MPASNVQNMARAKLAIRCNQPGLLVSMGDLRLDGVLLAPIRRGDRGLPHGTVQRRPPQLVFSVGSGERDVNFSLPDPESKWVLKYIVRLPNSA